MTYAQVETGFIPQGFVDVFVGFGDGVFDAITLPARILPGEAASLNDIRQAFGINGGVNTDSTVYNVGSIGGSVVGGGALYGGTAFRYIPALGPSSSLIGHPAYGGSTVNFLRGQARFG